MDDFAGIQITPDLLYCISVHPQIVGETNTVHYVIFDRFIACVSSSGSSI